MTTATTTNNLERLRASKRRLEDSLQAQGITAGREWAVNSAEAIELTRLKAFAERNNLPDNIHEWGETSSAEDLSAAIVDDNSEFWHFAVGDHMETELTSPAFLAGFIEGALDVWASV